MRAYPAALTPDPDGGFTVTFRNVPEAITEGDTRDEALLRAEDALESALAMYATAKEPPPTSSDAEAGEVMVPLRPWGWRKPHCTKQCAIKASAVQSWRVGYAGNFLQVNRVLDLRHASRMEHAEVALSTLGLRLIVDVARAADWVVVTGS